MKVEQIEQTDQESVTRIVAEAVKLMDDHMSVPAQEALRAGLTYARLKAVGVALSHGTLQITKVEEPDDSE